MLYYVIRGLFYLIYSIFFRLRIEWIGKVPEKGPAILISNHCSAWDPPLTVIATARPVYFMAKEELFRMPVFSFVLPRIHVFPVRRGVADRQAIRTSLEILRRGELLGLFPEGTRSKDGVLSGAEPGAAMFALRSQAPVIPVALINTHRMLKKGSFLAPLTVRVGEPVDLSEWYDQKATGAVLEQAGAKMMQALADLLPAEQTPPIRIIDRKVMRLEVTLAKTAGFCFGVKRALLMTEDAADRFSERKISTLGPLVHNRMVIRHLADQGIRPVEDVAEAQSGCLIIRAHGVAPAVVFQAEEMGLTVIDATCPYVNKAQRWAQQLHQEGYPVIIIGESDHAEVAGIRGWAGGDALILEKEEDAAALAYMDKAGVVVQTTQTQALVDAIVAILKTKTKDLKVFNSICSATEERQEEAAKLAGQVDVMLVVGGCNSANTRRLAAISRNAGARTYHIEPEKDLNAQWFTHSDRVGVTGGASTPQWIMEGVMDKMDELKKELEQAAEEKNEAEEVPETEIRSEEEIKEEAKEEIKEEAKEEIKEEEKVPEAPVEAMDEESDEVDMADVEKAYEESFVTLQEGQIVKGTVVQVGQNEALVDVGGYKSEGVIPLQELVNIWMNSPEEVVKKGDEIEVYVVSVEDQDGKLVLSKKRADEEKAMESIRAAYDAGELIPGVVKDVVKGGLIADIGMQAFIPASQAADRYVEDLRSLVGEEMKFKIIELDPRKRRVVLSRRKAIEEESAHKQKETLENLEEGQVLNGVVRRLTDFGAFVDIGGIDGLLHISEMSWGRIRHPSEVVSIGDTIEVKVLGVNRENNRISLGLKQVLPNPWEVAAENYPVGSIITGKVVRFTRFGAFIEIEPGIDGLLHISQISSKRVAKPEDALELEQMVEVKVIAQNPAEQKIGLSMIEVEQDRAKEEYLRFIAAQEEEQAEGGTIGDRFQKDEVPESEPADADPNEADTSEEK